MKLKRKEIKQVREELAAQQNYICPLCKGYMEPENTTLDHCHTHGNIRMALCRACNSAEGKVLSWAKRSGAADPAVFIENLLRYWDTDFSNNYIHPVHLNDEEKLIKQYRRLLKRSKRESTKQKYRDLIADVQRRMQNGTGWFK